MKLKNIIAYIKRKQFYFALFTCCLTIFLIAILVWTRPKAEDREIASLNGEGINSESTDVTSNLVDNEENVDIDDEEAVETSTVTNPITIGTEEVVGEDEEVVEEPVKEKKQEKTENVVLEITPVVKPNITFNEQEKMIWPVNGDILIPYSSETPVYFKTLDQYKVNTSLYIKSDVGTEVKVATEGIVEGFEYSQETGMTVTVYHGSGYKTIYGQLKKELLVKEGDLVKKGQLLGYIESPSEYHVLLEPHLYFKVMKDNDPVNPSDMIE
jgi:murein DD-endopeptidase MepM/ murein hydrolase activator NlpD